MPSAVNPAGPSAFPGQAGTVGALPRHRAGMGRFFGLLIWRLTLLGHRPATRWRSHSMRTASASWPSTSRKPSPTLAWAYRLTAARGATMSAGMLAAERSFHRLKGYQDMPALVAGLARPPSRRLSAEDSPGASPNFNSGRDILLAQPAARGTGPSGLSSGSALTARTAPASPGRWRRSCACPCRAGAC